MWDVRVCSACLATNVRIYSMSAASLLEPYQLLTGIKLESEGMPQKLCWECAALVHKFNMFRRKCERASLLLQDIYNQHDEVTEQDVLKVNREQHNLISSYSICPIEVYYLEIKTKSKECNKDKMSEAEKIDNNEQDNATMVPFVKLENVIIKKEEIPIDIKSESNDTELIDDVLIEEDCSQAVLLESPQKIKPVRKRRQRSKQKQKIERKTVRVVAKDFGMKEEHLSQEQQMEVMREKQNTEAYKTARFPCSLCCMPFSEEKAFNNHMLKHNPVSGEFICDICKMQHKTRREIHGHISKLHTKKYYCLSCPSVFYNRSTAKKHYAWHQGVVYTCSVCGATFNRYSSYQNHLRLKHPFGHVCDQCGEPFHTKKGLHQHMKIAHKLKRDTVASGGDHETRGPYCAECDIQFTCKQAWTRHVLISPKHQHEKHICALGCKRCGEMLPDEESLRAHRATHARSKRVITAQPNACKQKTCMKKRSCKHTSERRFMCDMCSKRFIRKQALQIHIRSHTKERPYKCKICGRGFSTGSGVDKHQRVHTNAKPYACEICSKCFKSCDTLKAHVDYVHMKKPWPKRDRSKRQNVNEQRGREHKREMIEQACIESSGNSVPASSS